MKVFKSKGNLPRLKSIEHNLFKGYIFHKEKRVSFFKIERKPKATKFELIYMDVWRHSTTTFIEGSNYYTTFIDDSSRNM